jgi:hypothetical protein
MDLRHLKERMDGRGERCVPVVFPFACLEFYVVDRDGLVPTDNSVNLMHVTELAESVVSRPI